LGITDPVYDDVSAARHAGYPDLLAPPSFLMAIEALAEDERARQGLPSWIDLLQCDMRYLLHGNETYTYSGPLFAGDEVTFVTEFLSFQDKKGGALEVAELGLHVSHATRGLLVSAKRSLLHRLN
jgi:acyl dehydratase